MRVWLEESRWDLLAIHLVPFLIVAALSFVMAASAACPVLRSKGEKGSIPTMTFMTSAVIRFRRQTKIVVLAKNQTIAAIVFQFGSHAICNF